VFSYTKQLPCSASQQNANNLKCYNTNCLISYNVTDSNEGSMDSVCQHLYRSMTETHITLVSCVLENTYIKLEEYETHGQIITSKIHINQVICLLSVDISIQNEV
jgi:hypothetical protein